MSWGDTQFDGPPRPTGWESLAPAWLVRRIVLIYPGLILPIVCFSITWREPLNSPGWRPGSLHSLAHLLLWGGTAYLFFPLLGYSMVCFGLAVFQLQWAAKNFAIRAGVFTGVLLAFHFSIVQCAAVNENANWRFMLLAPVFFFAAAAIAASFAFVGTLLAIAFVSWLLRGPYVIHKWLVAVLLPAVIICVAIAESSREVAEMCVGLLLSPIGISVLFAPYWTLFAYVFVSYELLRLQRNKGQFRLWQVLFAFTWLAVYLAAWRAAMQIALAE